MVVSVTRFVTGSSASHLFTLIACHGEIPGAAFLPKSLDQHHCQDEPVRGHGPRQPVNGERLLDQSTSCSNPSFSSMAPTGSKPP
jgi:hypothetical protein